MTAAEDALTSQQSGSGVSQVTGVCNTRAELDAHMTEMEEKLSLVGDDGPLVFVR